MAKYGIVVEDTEEGVTFSYGSIGETNPVDPCTLPDEEKTTAAVVVEAIIESLKDMNE